MTTAASRIALVTGANRGIGFCIIRALAIATPTDTFLLAGRSRDKIDEAITTLRATPELSQSRFEAVELDVTDDESILAAASDIKERFGRLDVLVNNAGIAKVPKPDDLPGTRAAYATVIDANVTSVANVVQAFIPLLLPQSPSTNTGKPRPLVVNVSSSRGSLERSATGGLPATISIPYCVSKTALNALTLELAKTHPGVAFHSVNPGHCATAFNGYRGARDPNEGAEVVVRLVERNVEVSAAEANVEDNAATAGFWETIGAGGKLQRVPW